MKAFNGISRAEAVELMKLTAPEAIFDLIDQARKVREQYCGNRVDACAIINAKSGNCGENCAFCPQSVHSQSEINRYPLKNADEITDAARRAGADHAVRFGIVTSGRAVVSRDEQDTICDALRKIKAENRIAPCASLGTVNRDFMQRMVDAGLARYHHNLEASASFYPSICTTRTYADNVQTVKTAKELGLTVCSGCLFGLGESNEQRVELLDDLRNLEVDSVPINFLNAIPGTRLEGKVAPLPPLECLKIIAVARLLMPSTGIRICGGREKNLRDMQSWIFAAGANSMMIGAYLTTGNRNVAADLQMIADAGMQLSTT